MANFVENNSIVRRIWGKSDTIMFIFAGAAAEFALNKAVDWLFFTGRLPSDPLGRLFSTVKYARMIVFSEMEKAHQVIDSMAAIHHQVESKRGMQIPAWAYRDVLYMLIDYSIRSHELLVRKLSIEEKREVYDVFKRVGVRMGLQDIPGSYETWLIDRHQHLQQDLAMSDFTKQLFLQYKKHLGAVRYYILLQGQGIIVPPIVRGQLRLKKYNLMWLIIPFYKLSALAKVDWFLKSLILPKEYFHDIKALEVN